jgi:squalene synthase HpnC
LKHYENFPVGRWGIPPGRRPDIHAVYAFARIADDYADEPEYEGDRLALLDEWGRRLESCRSGSDHPVFLALGETVNRLALPLEPFRDLLSAFRQDAEGRRYETWNSVLDYCRRSANPVGRLVLLISGQSAPELVPLSDALCTGLQLANFWQDLSVDLRRGRCYLPRADAVRFSVDLDRLIRGDAVDGARELLKLMFERTFALFEESRRLPGLLRGRLRIEISATWLGGRTILERSAALGERALITRPTLGFLSKLSIGLRAAGGWL